jgi:hypothetical protein
MINQRTVFFSPIYKSMEFMFQLDSLDLGNSGGGPTQRSGCLTLTNVTLEHITRIAHNEATSLVQRNKAITSLTQPNTSNTENSEIGMLLELSS